MGLRPDPRSPRRAQRAGDYARTLDRPPRGRGNRPGGGPDPRDRRAVELHLTAQSKPTVARLLSLGHGTAERALRGLDPGERTQLRTLLERVKRNLSEPAPQTQRRRRPGVDQLPPGPPGRDAESRRTVPVSRRRRRNLRLLPAGSSGCGHHRRAVLWYRLQLRYAEPDNACVKADKVLVSPEVDGYVARVLVSENERVVTGQPLLRLDEAALRIALDGARADLATARTRDRPSLRASTPEKLAELDAARRDLGFAPARRSAPGQARRSPARLAGACR
ncbi:MAG: biotin/lipoyl-binding protein [Gammaproteobacteria bacterium]|nr:biotin/lipoyl-binding protein [Gammaproteobacteria bacterium]